MNLAGQLLKVNCCVFMPPTKGDDPFYSDLFESLLPAWAVEDVYTCTWPEAVENQAQDILAWHNMFITS